MVCIMTDVIKYAPRVSAPITVDSANMLVTELALTGGNDALIGARANRMRLILINQSGTNRASFTLNGAAAVADRGLTLGTLGTAATNAGQHIWDSAGGMCPSDAIRVIGTAAQRVTAIEFFV
jgi:hypothetical protein